MPSRHGLAGMGRREFLAGSVASACGLVAGLGGTRLARSLSRSEHGPSLPALQPVDGVLELYFYGGLNPWDTFFCVPEWGSASAQFLHAFDLPTRLAPCLPQELLDMFGPGVAPTHTFARDDLGTDVHLGPWTWPLWSRPDILAQTRVVVMAHDQFPHASAIPLAVTGFSLGSPQLAGTGALVEALAGPAAFPQSAVIRSGREPLTDNLSATLSVGPHPQARRPLDLNLTQTPLLTGLLKRPSVGARASAHDALLATLRADYRRQLRGDQTHVRAPVLDRFEIADRRRARAPELAELLPPSLFGLPQVNSCEYTNISVPALAARLASHLLTRPKSQRSRYVLWVDDGLVPTADGGHDSHREHLHHASVNYPHTLQVLANRINRPGEDDPDKLNLDRNLIVITSEFGRTPWVEDSRQGLGHWPHGYVSILIGGHQAPPGPTIAGSIDGESATAQSYCSPTELRMALLLSLGLDPMVVEGWGASSVQGAANDAQALSRLAWILGGSL